MKIIITAAGLGSRFKKIGIKKPKFEIIVNNKSLFYWSLISLRKFFDKEFIFVFRKSIFHKNFIEKQLKLLKIKKYKFVIINKKTSGQAESVLMCQQHIKPSDSILIYNIDTHINPQVISKSWFAYDGLIVTMKASGSHWSFAKTDANSFAIQVSEKVRISNHASVGLYYFDKFKDFESVFKTHRRDIVTRWGETYICPMYQFLIDSGHKILVKDVPMKSVTCLGTPKEIVVFDKNFLKNNI